MVYDLIGIGFGPSNLSLNCYLSESGTGSSVKFFEKKSEFRWHSGMQIPNTYLQVSFLKDLVTQRNPRSKYTFLNFLHETGRLSSFINLRQFEPSRYEFEEYLKWVAAHFVDVVQYSSILKEIIPNARSDGTVKTVFLKIYNEQTSETEIYEAKNVSLALGGVPNIPKINCINERVIHSSNFNDSVKAVVAKDRERPLKFAVVGGGQSSIEMLLYLYNNFPDSNIDSIFSSFTYMQSDSSLFVNEVFHNRNVSRYFEGNSDVRREMILKNTNYGVVDELELNTLYRIHYDEKFRDKVRVKYRNFSRVESINVKSYSVELNLYNSENQERTCHEFDYVFLGTGFIRNQNGYLENLKEFLEFDNKGFAVNRDYSLKTDKKFKSKIFVIGHSEEQHGITNTLLSVNALRAEEIATSLA